MKYVLGFALALGMIGCQASGGQTKKIDTNNQQQKLSYTIGLSIGRNLKQQQIKADPASVAQGIQDALSGAKPQLTDDQMRATMEQYHKDAMARQQQMMGQNPHQQDVDPKLAENNLKAGQAFLAENAKKPGVKTLPSGLQYQVLTEGKGPKPGPNDTVVVNYRGTTIDGKEFDSSYKRGEPAVFPVNGVIQGWQEALQLMPVGSKWKLFIPANLAYGERGAGPDIGPNSTLIFETELVQIKK